MTFTTPLALLLLVLLPLFVYYGWPRFAFRRRRDTASLLLRLLIVLLLVLGVAGMQITHAAEKLAVVFLVDVSDSMDAAAQAAALDYVREAMAASGPDDQSAVVLFGSNALVERPMLTGTELGPIGSTPTTLNTDLAEAIRLGLALFPAETARRMVVLSDGVVTVGDAPEAARLAAASGVQIDFVPFRRQEAPEVAVTNVEVPSRLNVDEPFEINYTVESQVDTAAMVTLQAGGSTIARAIVQLREGENNYFFQLNAGFSSMGFSDIRVQVEPVETAADGFYQNNQLSAFTEISGPSRVLMVTRDGEEGQADIEHLRPALEELGLAIDVVTPDELPIGFAPLSAYASVVMVNVPASNLSPRRMEVLRGYVRDLGGGLVFIGGDKSYGVGGYFDTPIEETLPVEMQLHDQERIPALTIIFVIDTSGSMSAIGPSGFTNLDLAKEAIIRSIDLLNTTDRLGVLSFDTRSAWVVEVTPVTSRGALQEQVGTLRPGGGTDILTGVRTVAEYLPNDPSTFRHIILLTDGGASEEGIADLVRQMRIEQNTTTSVVAIGDGYAPFLQDLAVAGQGNFHFARDVSTIPTIFTAETLLVTRSYIVEEEFFPSQVGQNPILSGIERVPSLRGYVATTAKDNAQVLLRTPDSNADPILAAWQFGLGRAVAWTSDATSRWANNWVTWQNYPRLFSQMVRWTITEGRNSNLETRVEQRGEQAVLVVDARDNAGSFLNGLQLDAGIVSPNLAPQMISLVQVAPGRYEAAFAPGQEGAYFIRVSGAPGSGVDLPQNVNVAQTTGWVLTYSPEYRLPENGLNLELLNDLANLTGGESLAGRPAEVFTHNLAAASAATPLWPWLLLLATILLPFDVAVRRLIVTASDLRKLRTWLRDRLGLQPAAASHTRSERIDRLMGARERIRSETSARHLPGDAPSAVDTILPADERKEPTPAAPTPAPPEPGSASAAAASLAARRRAARSQETPTPATPLPTSEPRPEPVPVSRPSPVPQRPTGEGSTVSQLLKRRRQEAEEDQPADEDPPAEE